MNRCLRCYRNLELDEQDLHKECADEALFDGVDMSKTAEELTKITNDRVTTLPLSIFESSSMNDSSYLNEGVISDGNFLFYSEGAAVADLTMKLAQASHIVTASHSLFRLSDGSLSMAVRRIDRDSRGVPFPMESLCQISELTFAERYEGSYAETMEMIEEYSSVNRIDIISLWECVVFAWICGYSDFNLSQIALYEPYAGICSLAPLRFATSTALSDPSLLGAMALDVNGRRVGIGRVDLEAAMRSTALKNRAINLIFKKFVASRDIWLELVDNSFLDQEQKQDYKKILINQLKSLEL
ncbi:MAG: HipA domain-containing protein [Rikenellaceae bacterium]